MNADAVSQLGQLEAEIGERLASREGGSEDLSRYRGRPVDFTKEVLEGEPLAVQEEIAEALLVHRQVVVQSCNGAGKDWLAGRLALWWAYARGGLVLVLGPTERQVKEIVMRNEIRPAWTRAGLSGQLHELALRIGDRTGILAMTSTDASKLTGFHAPSLLVVITEAQGVEAHTWEAALANTTGEDSAILAVGNPLAPVGRFFEVCRSRRWRRFKVSAFDHPNVQTGQELVPGAVTRGFVENMREEYGEESPIYQARVLGEFPTDAEDVLCKRTWLEQAAARWEEWRAEAESANRPYRLALDPARYGADETILALAQGSVLLEFRAWRRTSTMESTGKLMEALGTLEEEGAARHVEEIAVDEIGLGGGVVDRLQEQGRRVEAFNGARAPQDDEVRGRFANRRAEAFWHLRTLLERGRIALPHDELLFEELMSIRWTVSSSGKVQLESKDLTRRTLGRSPDRADAVSMVFANHLSRSRFRVEAYYPGCEEDAA